jgi:glyoxylase-like metal-dependent hydrolase (beta-lactamase superfamily II)
VRLHPLLACEMLSPPGLLDRPQGRGVTLRVFSTPRRKRIWIPIPAFLVEHPSAGPVLIDTGMHPSVAIDPAKSMGRFFGGVLLRNGVQMEPEQALPDQLRERGVDPASVPTVVMTHLHYDHASGVSQFPDATFLVDAREWEAASGERATRRGYHPPQYDHAFDWRAIDYGAREIDSFSAFGRSVDVFGDGSVRLVSTPGHTAGHQSVVLRLREREALLTGDAAYLTQTITGDAEPLLAEDRHLFHRSLREIRGYLDQTPGALVITGHDRDLWPTLDPVYD